jgi:ankyrin repeat protein
MRRLALVFAVLALLSACAKDDTESPLMHAVSVGDRTEASRLIRAGADANQADQVDYYPIWEAAHNGDLPMVRVLVSGGARASIAGTDGWTVLMSAATGHASASLVDFLISKGADVCATDRTGEFKGLRASQIAQKNHSILTTSLSEAELKCGPP